MMPRILVLYEYSPVGLPHGSAYIRLLQPLAHPAVRQRFYVTPAPVYYGQAAEIVIVDRFWRPDCTPEMAETLVQTVQKQGAKLVYQLDDDLLALPGDHPTASSKRKIARIFLQEADCVIVSTATLRTRYASHNRHIHVVGNALDEHLLVSAERTRTSATKLIIGYMGTHTHDDDLHMLLPALEELGPTADGQPLELQMIGGSARPDTLALLNRLPFPVIQCTPPVIEYPQFLPWFTANVVWDIALAPLVDTPFNRAKSDIKFLDYAGLGTPGIYSDLPVYNETVRHGETGMLAANTTESWGAALRTLIKHPDLRRELTANARRYLHNERILAHRAVDWADTLEMIWKG